MLAPTGRDAALARSVLVEAGFHAIACPDMDALCDAVGVGAGLVLLAEEALSPPDLRRLAGALREQPPWSDIPLVVFSGTDASAAATLRTTEAIAALGNVTLLDWPIRVVSLLSAVRVALRARRRQYQVRDLLAQLERAVRDRDQFLATLGHELRNPLAAIVFALDLLDRTDVPDEKVQRRFQTIGRHVGQLNRLVDDLLDVARVTSGKITLSRARLDLVGLVERCAESAAAQARAHGVTLVVAGAPGSLVVEGDAVRLEQVVTNLLTNAIKYTPAGGRVRVVVSSDAGWAVVAVEDTGVGLAPEMLQRIFEPFTQVEASLDRSRGGLGLGLSLVRKLVELHGGAVRAASDGLGRGSRFTVNLPLAVAAPGPSADLGDDGAARGPASGAGAAARHVVIIEDNADVRESLQLLLESSGHRVAAAEDGSSGVARVLDTKPDVVLVDLGLPGLDGYEVARAIRSQLGKSVFLAAISGYGQPEDRRRAMDAGFDTHLTKPVTIETVEKLLGS
ncbi:MAG: hybrid sensor histidine kinase/response regulator [Minicystis sp.]